MTFSISNQDLQRLEDDPDSFPREFSTDSLKAILETVKDAWVQNAAQRELTIRESGIQLYGIFPTDNTQGPSFTYSVGADRVDLPEMLSFYPSYQSNAWVINKLYQLMLDLKVELPTEVGEVVMVDGILEGLPIALTLLSQEQRTAAWEDFTCQVTDADTPVMQILMPLPNGQWVTSMIPDEYKVPEIEAIAVDPSEVRR